MKNKLLAPLYWLSALSVFIALAVSELIAPDSFWLSLLIFSIIVLPGCLLAVVLQKVSEKGEK